MGWIHNANAAVARSFVGKYFRLEGSGHVSMIGRVAGGTTDNILAKGAKRFILLYRSARWFSYILCYGLHYQRQCDHRLAVWRYMRLPARFSRSMRQRPGLHALRAGSQPRHYHRNSSNLSLDFVLHGSIRQYADSVGSR
jgi:hypothetical protein